MYLCTNNPNEGINELLGRQKSIESFFFFQFWQHMFALFLASPPSKIQLCSLSNERSQKTISVTWRLNDRKAGGDLNAFVV